MEYLVEYYGCIWVWFSVYRGYGKDDVIDLILVVCWVDWIVCVFFE